MRKGSPREGEGDQDTRPVSAIAGEPLAGLFAGPRKAGGKQGEQEEMCL